MEVKELDWLGYIRYLFLRLVLWWTRASRVSRFDGILDFDQDDPFKYGALQSSREVEEDWPYPTEQLIGRKIDDVLTVFCASPKGQILTVCMRRFHNKTASVFLYLKTLSKKYSLEKEFFVDLSSEDTFAVDGLRMECVLPMRRWRFSFNGLLK